MTILHPMANEIIDQDALKPWTWLADHIELATAIVLASIQKLVLTNSKAFTFSEVYSVEAIDN